MPSPFRALLPVTMTLLLAACSTGGGGLAPGLAQRMDSQGAQLDRSTALSVVNQYRATVGAGALTEDAGLDATADQLVAQYAKTGTQPPKPAGVLDIRYSAGYFTFAETFSGWRNSPSDAPALIDKAATKAGVAAVYDANSGYGVYWVLLLE